MKTLIKYQYIVVTMLLVVLSTTSCEDNLDIPQQGVTSVENFYQTDDDAEQAIAAVYNAWRETLYANYFLTNLLSDDMFCGGGSRGDNSQFEQINEYSFSPANTSISSLFSQYYTAIYLANLTINKLDNDTTVKQRAKAEAYVVRAAIYFQLVTLWGEVPMVTGDLDPSEYQQPNASLQELWALIEDDFNIALSMDVLPHMGDETNAAEPARLTYEAAQSFLGKAYLFQEKYDEAATTLKSVINSGVYTLYTDYDNILRAVADFSDENVFEFNSLFDEANAFTQGNLLWGSMIGWRSDKLNLFGYFYGQHPIYPAGWGFANPTTDLYDAFVAMEGTDGYRLNSTIKTYNDLLGMGITLYDGSSLYGCEGYFNWKNRYVGSEVISSSYGFTTSNNQRVMRYAEVLLMASEACLQSGDTGNALSYINQVRSRAQLEDLSTVTLDDIKKEKRLELCFESVRFQDLVRWGDTSVLANQGATVPIFSGLNGDGSFNVTYPYTNSVYGFKDKHNLLPFPEHEMNVNQNITQNSGW